MNDNVKNIVLVIIAGIFVFGAFAVNLFTPDETISISERRELANLPTFSFTKIKENVDKIIEKSGDEVSLIETYIKQFDNEVESFTQNFEKYTLDHFVGRDAYRTLKAFVAFNIFNQSDNNKIYIADGHASEYFDTLKEGDINAAIKAYNKLYEKFLKGMNVYYSIIPDKNYFIAEENGYPVVDYEQFEKMITDGVNKNIKYIDIFDELTIDDYYKTDIHWRQENLDKVINKLASNMNFKPYNNYTENELEGFYGVYYGQSALPMTSETLKYYTADFMEDVTVKFFDTEEWKYVEKEMYDLEGYKGVDPYDIYLHGPEPAIVIENPNAASDKELILFRDSFGSSLAPLLINGYKKITILDLRYMDTRLYTDEIVEFNKGQDVLIMNCTSVLNNASIFKVN